jgi:O-antigen/teichoic acid export membrane protein
VVRWRAQAQTGGGSRIRQGLIGGTLAAVALAALGGAVGWLIGPWLVQLIYGEAYQVGSGDAALLVASTFLLGWAALISAALIAFAAYRRMILLWLVATGLTAIWLAISPLDVIDTTAVGALVGPLAGIAFGLPALWSLARRDRSDHGQAAA